MAGFTNQKAYKKLVELARNPVDLSQEGTLTTERLGSMVAEGAGLKLLFGTERVSEEVLKTLFELAEESDVHSKMEKMQNGEVINKIEGFESENRMVLHTAMRDFFQHKISAKPAKEAAEAAYKEVEKLKKFLEEIDQSKAYTDLIQVGIGGSDLGPRAIYYALEAYKRPDRRVHFVSNVDPDDGAKVFSEVNLSKTLIVVVSKSGSTLETAANQAFAEEFLKKKGLDPKKHLIAVTGEKSPMDDPSKYLRSFYMWDYVGGRYSVTSMVGGVMLSFVLGFDNFMQFLEGASQMDKLALDKDPKKNLPLLSALLGIWNRNFLNLPTVAIIPYSQGMYRFPAHLQQLDMESNGKHIDKQGREVTFETGPIIWGEPGTNGQHSFYQCIHQGTTVVPLEFIGFKHSQYECDVEYKGTNSQEKLLSNLFAQSVALAVGQKSSNPNKQFKGNRPNRILLAEKLDPRTLGKILAYYEHKVAFQGFLWNINSFDQEGVQLGKVLAMKFIDKFAAKKTGKALDFADFPIAESFFKHL